MTHSAENSRVEFTPSEVRSRRGFLIAFFMILAFGVVSVEAIGWRIGFTSPASLIAAEQESNGELLYYPVDIKYFASYKLAREAIVKPEVISLGSSRCNQIRSEMFRPYSFYNFCLTSWSTSQLYRTFELATRFHRPKVAFIELDYFMMTDAWDNAYPERDPQTMASFDYHLDALAILLKRLLTHPETFGRVLNKTLNADDETRDVAGSPIIYYRMGFRPDGSFSPPRGQIEHAPQANVDIRNGLINSMPGGPAVTPRQLGNVEALTKLARERGVSIVAVQLPILGATADFLDNDEGYRHYSGVWREVKTDAFKDKLAAMGVPFFDMSRAPGMEDARYFLDPAHPNDAATLRAYAAVLSDPKVRELLPRIDAAGLKTDFDRAVANNRFYSVYDTSN